MYYEHYVQLISHLESLNYWDEVKVLPKESETMWIDQITPYLNIDNYGIYKGRKSFKYEDAHKFFGEFTILPNKPSMDVNTFLGELNSIDILRDVVNSMFENGYDWRWFTLENNEANYEVNPVLNLFVGRMLEYEFEDVIVEDPFVDNASTTESRLISVREADNWLCLLYFDKGVKSANAPLYKETEDYLI